MLPFLSIDTMRYQNTTASSQRRPYKRHKDHNIPNQKVHLMSLSVL